MDAVTKIRHFNRFYTNLLGLLNKNLPKSAFSLAEARILFEINQLPNLTASDIVNALNLDSAYLSRILKNFKKRGLIHRKKSPDDSRKHLLSLTEKGQSSIGKLQAVTHLQIAGLTDGIPEENLTGLVNAMETIEQTLKNKRSEPEIVLFRSHQPGDIGSVIHHHGLFYSTNHGFDDSFDADVAKGLAAFIHNFNPEKEHLWVVEKDGRIIGSIAIVDRGNDTAQLRWFLVKPRAQGKGIGKKLVLQAIEFSKKQGYKTIILWTISYLLPARQLYQQFNFKLKDTKTHKIWGQELTEELWELGLAD